MKKMIPVLLMAILAVNALLFVVAPAPSQAQQNTATPSRTPRPTRTPTATPEPPLLENVPVARGGIEVFPLPDRKSGRIFAAATGTFAPHVAGRDAEEKWLFIYYFDRGVLKAGWSPRRGLVLEDEEVTALPVIDPEDAPELPDLEFNELASRPYGTRRPSTSATATPTSSSDTGNTNNPPPPQPTSTQPAGTQEP
ncbi:MAG: hypothetical protein HY862_11950 [Chloroflexi bacterium]|nr:hypothetical protein [Chloroflexota bacterium]